MTTTHPTNPATDSPLPDNGEREIVVSRLLNAPRELVFQAWTQPQHIAKWWGPKGFSTTVHSMDVRPGGVWDYVMHGPNGEDYPDRVVFQEVTPPERLVFLFGAPVPCTVTVTLEEQENRTLLTMSWLCASVEDRNKLAEMGAVEGANSTLDNLEEHLAQMGGEAKNKLTLSLPSELEIVLTRDFNAPPHLVFTAWTKPEHIRRWWGANGSAMPVCDVDLRVGGAWRYVLQDPNGQEHGFNGVYREIEAPNRLVHTIIYEPMPEHEAIVTVEFKENAGKTTLTETTLHKTTEARDAHLQSGMAEGIVVPFAALDELLEEIA